MLETTETDRPDADAWLGPFETRAEAVRRVRAIASHTATVLVLEQSGAFYSTDSTMYDPDAYDGAPVPPMPIGTLTIATGGLLT